MDLHAQSLGDAHWQRFLKLACDPAGTLSSMEMMAPEYDFVVRADGANRGQLVVELVMVELAYADAIFGQWSGNVMVVIKTAPGALHLSEAKHIVIAIRNATAWNERFRYSTCYDAALCDTLEVQVSISRNPV